VDGDFIFSVHFSRFPVTQIGLSVEGLAQFADEPILAAARLLAHAQVDARGWSGTSAGWLGFDHGERLCEAIRDATSLPATTSTLGLNRALELWQVKELELVTPYILAVNNAIRRNDTGIGIKVDSNVERHLGITDNMAIGEVSEAQLDIMVEEVVSSGAKLVTTFCTNLRAARRELLIRRENMALWSLAQWLQFVWDMLRTLCQCRCTWKLEQRQAQKRCERAPYVYFARR
jgi:maleate isomerase